MKKFSRKEKEFQSREQEILNNSLNLFLKYGMDKVSIERIAVETGVAKGTIYNHFKSKEEIFAHLFIMLSERLIRRVQELDESLPVLNQLKDYLSIHIDFAFTNLKEYKLYMNFQHILFNSNITPELQKIMNKNEQFLHKFAEKIMQKGIDEGILKNMPVKNLVCIADGVFAGVINSSMNGYYSSTLKDKKELFSCLGEILMNGAVKKQNI